MRTIELAPRGGTRTAIRLRPLPSYDPPFDDELSADFWAPVHQLALEWRRPSALDQRTGGGGADAGGRIDATGQTGAVEKVGAARSGPAAGAGSASDDARMAVQRFMGMCLEVLNGYRPAAHLRRLALPTEAAGVIAQAVAGAKRVAERRRSAAGAAAANRVPNPAIAKIRNVLACQPRADAVEATVVLATGERTWALALRLELHNQSWAATVLRML
jgi:hypothetical protein